MTRHLMAPDRARFSVANLRIFAITSFTRDLRPEPDGFSPQPARARLDQRFLDLLLRSRSSKQPNAMYVIAESVTVCWLRSLFLQ